MHLPFVRRRQPERIPDLYPGGRRLGDRRSASRRERRLRRAERSVARGRLAPALRSYRDALREAPHDVSLLNRTGDLLIRNGNVGDAVALFLRVARRHADDGFADRAIAVYRKILRHDPFVVEAHERLAELYRDRGLPVEARRYAERAVC